MRPSLLLLVPFLLGLLTACDPGPKVGPRIDFVGSSRFTSSDRIVSTPGDTISTFIYADNRDPDTNQTNNKDYTYLSHLRIYVKYEPGLVPSTYPNGPATLLGPTPDYLYLDSTLAPNTSNLVFRHDFTARTTPGRETWRFEIEDAEGRHASRQYQLTVRRADSAAIVHIYNTLLQAPLSQTRLRRSYLDATNGLALTGYAASHPEFQQLIDLAYVPGANNGFGLAAPYSTSATATNQAGTSAWPTKNKTDLRETTLTAEAFGSINTEAGLLTSFNDASASKDYLPSIAEGKVIAFRTTTDSLRTGLIYVQDILSTTIPTVLLQVRVSKRRIQ